MPVEFIHQSDMPADRIIALRDAIRYDVNVQDMSHADVAQKHDLTIRSINVALDNEDVALHYVHLTQLGTGATASIKVLAPKGVTYEEIISNWKAF